MNLIVNQSKLHEHLSKLGNEAILKCNAIVTEVGLDLEEKVRQEEKCGLWTRVIVHIYSAACVEGARMKRTLNQFEEADKGWKKENKRIGPL